MNARIERTTPNNIEIKVSYPQGSTTSTASFSFSRNIEIQPGGEIRIGFTHKVEASRHFPREEGMEMARPLARKYWESTPVVLSKAQQELVNLCRVFRDCDPADPESVKQYFQESIQIAIWMHRVEAREKKGWLQCAE